MLFLVETESERKYLCRVSLYPAAFTREDSLDVDRRDSPIRNTDSGRVIARAGRIGDVVKQCHSCEGTVLIDGILSIPAAK